MKSYNNILIAIDLTAASLSENMLAVACRLARDHDAVMHAVTVVPDFGMSMVGAYFPDNFEKESGEKVEKSLRDFVEEHRICLVETKIHVLHGRIYEEINEAAEKLKCDLIIVGAHHPDFGDYLLGSNAARVVRHAKTSVMVVRA